MGIRTPAGMFSRERSSIVIFVIVNDEGGVDVGFGDGLRGPARRGQRRIHGEERWCSAVGANKMGQILDGLVLGQRKANELGPYRTFFLMGRELYCSVFGIQLGV